MDDLAALLLTLLGRIARAKTLAEVNIAAGIACEELSALPEAQQEIVELLLDTG